MKKVIAMLAAACTLAASFSVPVMADDAGGRTDLIIAVDADVASLHPFEFSTTVEIDVLDQIYDTLMYMNPDGEHEPEPRVAESYEISEDGLDYTFHIRDDVKFHDGTPVTVEDIVFSIEQYKESEYQGSQISMLSSVEATDDHTVVCHLDTPYAPFLLGLCSPYITSKAYYDSDPDGFATKPMGCGPYKFVNRTIGTSIELEANEDYYRGAPSIKKVTFNVLPEITTRAISLMSKTIDFAEVDATVLSQLETDDTIQVDEVLTSGFAYVSMNLEKEPFNDPLVRQAVNYAIDRENIVNVCYEGKAEVNSNICAKHRFGYSDDQLQYTYDPEKAKELLAEAGIETPYNLGSLLVAEEYSNLAAVVQNDLKQVGLEVEIDTREFNSFIGSLTEGDYTISVLQMALEGDTQQLEMAFITDYIGMANNARYSDPEMDDLFNQTRAETDTAKREELFHQILEKAQNEAIYAVLCNPLTIYAHSTDLKCPEFPLEGNYYVYDFSW